MNKQFFAIIIVIVVALVGVFALTNKKDGGNNGTNSNAAASEHVVGKADAKVTLVEYGDFQCPACKSYFPIVNQIKEEYKDRIKFQFRHFPLVQIHPNAFIGSRAAEAAGKQDAAGSSEKFFAMHDLLYQNQKTWSSSSNATSVVEGYAQQLNLDMNKFKADFAASATADTINADVKAAQAVGGNSTPTFVINNKKVDKNPQTLEDFKKLIDEALAANP